MAVPTERVIETVLLALVAVALLFTGVWGLRGREVWLPPAGADDSPLALSSADAHQTTKGPGARLIGAACLVAGAWIVIALVRLWLRDLTPGV